MKHYMRLTVHCVARLKWLGVFVKSREGKLDGHFLHGRQMAWTEGPSRVDESTGKVPCWSEKKKAARPVSARLGLHILDINIVKHNLRVGAAFERNPDFGALAFITHAQAALLSRGSVPESPQLSFDIQILPVPLEGPQYRSASTTDYGFSAWQPVFEPAHIRPGSLDVTLAAPRHHLRTVHELLLKSCISVVTDRLQQHMFLTSLSLDGNDCATSTGFSKQEHEIFVRPVLSMGAQNVHDPPAR
ncbi:hypothetical protein GQ600_8863 [Phytophthora cactorum]|nr:hypothetical protein GQ600_8863 [Phytophthora cactorum]